MKQKPKKNVSIVLKIKTRKVFWMNRLKRQKRKQKEVTLNCLNCQKMKNLSQLRENLWKRNV